MDLQISHEKLTQNRGIFNQSDIRQLVQQSVIKAEKRVRGQNVKQSDYQDNKNTHLIRVQYSKYSFDNISKTIYFLDHQLISLDQNTVEKSLLQLSNFFQFLFQNPSHKIKGAEIINMHATQNQIHTKLSIQSLNPLIARILDMFLNSKIFVFKNYIADILIRYSFFIKQMIIKEELLQVLNKGIKGFDEYTRIISVKIIPSFIEMFEKDLVGFQYIIHKIQSFDQTTFSNVSNLVQKLSFAECLKKMLQKSEILSSFFIKNLKEQTDIINFHPISKTMNVNQMLILRFCEFCLHLKINTSSSLNLFKNLLRIYKNRSKLIENLDLEVLKKLNLLISKIFLKLFYQNFKVLEAIYAENLEEQIQVDIGVINRKLKSFDIHQQKHILKDCPQKLRQLLNSNQEKSCQRSQSLQQKIFMKFYEKLNEIDTENLQSQISMRKNLIVKQRRLEQFLELCEQQKHKQISSLIKIWLHIYSLMLDLLNKSEEQVIQKKLETLKSLIQKLASQYQNLQEQLFISAEVFLLLQKCFKSHNAQYIFKQTLWTNSQKLPVQNKHFLKWTFLSQKTLSKLIF